MRIEEKTNINLSDESGIALIIALVMLLVMCVMAISVSFLSNTDFQTMTNFKRGQEAFLAAETCVNETRRQIAQEGLAFLLFKQASQKSTDPLIEPLDIDIADSNSNLIKDSDGIGAKCRSGSRLMDSTVVASIDPIFEFPEDAKSIARDLRGFSKDAASPSNPQATPIVFTVIGKDAKDRDKNDEEIQVNTGTQLATGVEAFLLGGTNVY